MITLMQYYSRLYIWFVTMIMMVTMVVTVSTHCVRNSDTSIENGGKEYTKEWIQLNAKKSNNKMIEKQKKQKQQQQQVHVHHHIENATSGSVIVFLTSQVLSQSTKKLNNKHPLHIHGARHGWSHTHSICVFMTYFLQDYPL